MKSYIYLITIKHVNNRPKYYTCIHNHKQHDKNYKSIVNSGSKTELVLWSNSDVVARTLSTFCTRNPLIALII